MKDFALALHSCKWIDFLTISKRYKSSSLFDSPPLHNRMIRYTYIAPTCFISNALFGSTTPDFNFSQLKNS